MKRTHQRLTALCLVVCMLLPLFAGSVSAETVSEDAITLDAATVPECMSYTDAVQAGHIERLNTAEQDLNTVIFRNSDASDTIYMFGENVKYIGSDGAVHDKSNALSRKLDGSYRNSANDILVTYPAKVASGIALQAAGLSMQMVPAYTNNASVTATQDEDSDIIKTVSYIGAFGTATVLQYTQTYSGFKEDIILGKRMALNTFSFTVTTNGAEIVMESGVACVYYGGNLVGKFGEVYAYDTAGHTVFGTTAVTEVTPNHTYTLTISVPVSFLNDESTVFPVVIDPSYTMVGSSTTELVQDTTIYTNYSSSTGSSSTLMVGNFNALGSTQLGTARGLVKFNYLTTNSTVNEYLRVGRTFSSVNYVFCGSGTVSQANTITAYMMTSNWTESSVYSSSLWNGYSSTYGTSSVTIAANSDPSDHTRYELDIKTFFNNWYNGSSNYGIMLKSTNESLAAVAICSWEHGSVYGTSGTKPYIRFDAAPLPTTETTGIIHNGVYQIVNTDYDYALKYDGDDIYTSTSNPTQMAQQFILRYEGNGRYSIISYADTDVYLCGSLEAPIYASDASNTYLDEWYIIPTTGGYRFYSENGTYLMADQTIIDEEGNETSDVVNVNSLDGAEWELTLLYRNVPWLEQLTDVTCNAACGLMVLNYFGCTGITEATFKATASGTDGDYGRVGNIISALNYYLDQANVSVTYGYNILKNESVDYYLSLIQCNIDDGYPIIAQVKIPENDDIFWDGTSGHYIVIKGLYFDSSKNEYIVVVNDPNDDDTGEPSEQQGNYSPQDEVNNVYHIPLSRMREYIKNHQTGWVICVNTEVPQ